MAIRVGVVGFGTIGTGVVHLLRHNAAVIRAKTGLDLVLAAVADVDLERDRGVSLDGVRTFRDGMELVKDPGVDIVVELVGGTEFPRKLVLAALDSGKHVVTANKALLAKHGPEIYAAAAAKGLALGIEASVAGGIPVIKALRESLAGNRVQEIRGIVNGTTNYILTKMAEEGHAYADALVQAQKLGFAEADPTLDVTGGDAAHKIAILASLAFTTPVDVSALHVEGIDKIAADDIRFAAELGYVVKLIAVARDRGALGVEARVHPMLVPRGDQLAGIRNEFNAVFVRCDYLGDAMFTGRGAGSFPTASAVVGDLCDIAHKIERHESIPPFIDLSSPRPLVPFGECRNRYYLRLTTLDKPGVLAQVTRLLGERGISIASVIQKEAAAADAGVPVVMVTHEAREADIAAAVAGIDALAEAVRPTVILRAL